MTPERTSREEVFERLLREHISSELAWWLACLDFRVAEICERLDKPIERGDDDEAER